MTADPLPNPPPEYRESEPDITSAARRRFVVWIIVVTGLLVFAPLWFAADRHFRNDFVLKTGAAVMTLLAWSIAVLIATTPPDAIRLPPLRSIAYLIAGTAWLVVAAEVFRDGSIWRFHSPLQRSDALVPAAGMLATALVYRRVTPWWTAVVIWNPLAVGPAAMWADLVADGVVLIAVGVLVGAWLRRVV